MESIKKWLSNRAVKKNGFYVNYSPPRTLGAVTGAQLRQWARGGSDSRLEKAVLAGQGRRLLAEAESLPLSRHLPALIAKCKSVHAAVERGSLPELQKLLEPESSRRKYVMCSDEAGVGLLHKAIYYDFMDIAEWLVNNYPQTVHQRDSEGRTPLHYAVLCRDVAAAAALLEGAGAVRGARDAAGSTPAHYRGLTRSQLTLPAVTPADMARETKNKQPGMAIKRSNIRIWCHDCDMTRLQRVVWEGHGSQLLSEVCNQPVVRKFLEAVPYMMNSIRELHQAVVKNDLEAVMKHSSDPIPPVILSSRDSNYMTVFHKAAGLGHCGILNYISERYPQGVNDVDNENRTPLHFAASVRDDQHTFNTLVGLGADETVLDNKHKTPAFYINKPQEIDKHMLKVVPDAPRTASSAYPATWDWKLLDTEVIAELHKKSRRRNVKASSDLTTTETTEHNPTNMKTSSTQEFIRDLPDLDDINKPAKYQIKKNNNNDETDIKDLQDDELQEEKDNIDKENEDADDTKAAKQEGSDEEDENLHLNNDEIANNQNGESIEKIGIDQNEENVEISGIDQSTLEETNDHSEENSELNVKNDDENNDKSDDEENVASREDEASPTVEDKDKELIDESNENNVESTQEVIKIDIIDAPPNEVENNSVEIELIKENDDDENDGEGDDVDIENDDEGENKNSKDVFEETGSEGNLIKSNKEDDDDVYVHGEPESELSTISTNEVPKSLSAKRDTIDISPGTSNENNGRSTRESLIEGIIEGDIEMDSQDASISKNPGLIRGDMLIVDHEVDLEVTELINTANMEMLAALVLNGEGARLLRRVSSNSELQAFLDNVPAYMKKINKVHQSARDGNIKDLQAALDRRKFAIARDPISANGATPLHVATIFGKTNIIKYLGGRFPETLSAVDFEGRTSLHYAAILPDNGHYYHLLQQLGANSKDLDDNGRSAEEYYSNPSLLSSEQLLSDFGISKEEMHEMFSDKVPEDQVSSRRLLDTPEAIDTLERCYRLLASARPSKTPLSAASNRSTPPLIIGRFLSRSIFEAVKCRVTKLDHDLFDIIWPAVKKLPDNRNIVQTIEEDFPGGIAAPDYYAYAVFEEFLMPLIKDLHNLNVHSELQKHPKTDFKMNAASSTHLEPLIELNIDPNNNFVLSGTMECMRNLEGFELPLNLTVGNLEEIESILTALLMVDEFAKFIEPSSPESDQKCGIYYSLNEVLENPSEIRAALASAGLLIALCDKDEIDDNARLHGKHWPYGRGVYVSDDKTVAVWINVHDHLRVMTVTPVETPGEIGLAFSRLTHIMGYLHEKLSFVWDSKIGYLSSRPTFVGSGIHYSLIVNFAGLSKDSDNLKHLCAMRGLQYRETHAPHIARVSNYQSLSITETNCFNDFSTATSNLLHLEKDLSMQSSTHISTILTNLFRRKKSILNDLEPLE